MSRTSTDLPDAFWSPENRNGPFFFFFLNSCSFFFFTRDTCFVKKKCWMLYSEMIHVLDFKMFTVWIGIMWQVKKRNQRSCLCNVWESDVKWFSENIYSQNDFQIICWKNIPPPPKQVINLTFTFWERIRLNGVQRSFDQRFFFFFSKKLLFPVSIVIFWKFLVQSFSFVGNSEINHHADLSCFVLLMICKELNFCFLPSRNLKSFHDHVWCSSFCDVTYYSFWEVIHWKMLLIGSGM